MDNKLEALERLAKLKAEGTISEAEFEVQKARLLTDRAPVPLVRRLWFVVLLTCLLITFPVALIILASGPIYKKGENGPEPISRGARLTYAALLALWLVALVAKAIIHPGDWGTDGSKGQSPPPQTTAQANGTAAPNAPNAPTAATVPANPSAAPSPPAAQAQARGEVSTDLPACNDPKLQQMILEGMQGGFDRLGMPFSPDARQILTHLVERDSEASARYKRVLTNRTDGQFQPEEVRICEAEDTRYQDFGITAVIRHNGKLGGYILNSGFGSPCHSGSSGIGFRE